MEYLLLAIVLAEGGFIFKLLSNKKPKELTIEEKERQRLERIEKNYQKLFNYSEDIATRGYKDEE